MSDPDSLLRWTKRFPNDPKCTRAQLNQLCSKLGPDARKALERLTTHWGTLEDSRSLKQRIAAARAAGIFDAKEYRSTQRKEALRAQLAQLEKQVASKSSAATAQRVRTCVSRNRRIQRARI